MLLRHFRIHPPKIRVSTPSSKKFHLNGARSGKSSLLHHPFNPSTPTNTPTAESVSDRPRLFAHVDKALHQLNTKTSPQNSAPPPRELTRNRVIDESNLRQTLETGDPILIEETLKDILQVYGRPSSNKSTLDFLVQENVLRVLSLPTLRTVLSFVKPRGVHLATPAIIYLAQRLASSNQVEEIKPILSLVQPHLLNKLQHLCPAKPHSVSYQPPDIVKATFLLVHAFLRVNVEEAINLFQHLIDSRHIPSEAMVDSSSSQTLEQVMDMSLVKASLYWNWSDVTCVILSYLLQSSSAPDSFTVRHATECLYTLLLTPSPKGLNHCLKITRFLHPHAPAPDSLIRQFYNCASDTNAVRAAEDLYDFSRDPSVLTTHRYPAPQGRALTKLMFHLVEASKKVRLVRALAFDTVQDHLLIPLNDRARFIAVIAGKGFASSARALWELYAAGKDGSFVYGDSRLMVRMVKLFTKLGHRPQFKVDHQKVDNMDNVQTVQMSEPQSFVCHVMSKFKEHHEPWKNAEHRAMTSYARACFIVGKNTEGFHIFKVLLGRLELPDLHDFNVALSAVAKLSPKIAVDMIKTMEGRGLVPDAVTFGTVLHYASSQDRTQVVEEMLDRIMRLETLLSDVQVLGTVVRAVVKSEADDTQKTRFLKLRTALKLVHQFTKDGAQTSPQLGNCLVSLALEAQHAPLAFKFWNLLLRESEEYDDGKQRQQRDAIIKLVQEQNMRLEINGADARMIVKALNRGNTRQTGFMGRVDVKASS